MFRWWLNKRMHSTSLAASVEARPDVGSSMTSTAGRETIASATDRRRRSPPLSLPPRVLRVWMMPRSSQSSSRNWSLALALDSRSCSVIARSSLWWRWRW